MAALYTLALALLVVLLSCQLSDATSLTVNTTNGPVTGISAGNGSLYFYGIPYAQPPVGPLRWKPPQPASNWTSLSANTQPPQCQQVNDQNVPRGQEDCLYINVYAPDSNETNLAVMIWIHGGGFESGSPNQYDASAIVRQGNVIVFSIGYRLGVFSNLLQRDIASLVGAKSTNFGTQDQTLAIQWIKNNAAAFGGNANQITVFGESSGACSALTQAILPVNEGVITRVISESAASIFLAERNYSLQLGDQFTNASGCSGASNVTDCLYGLTASQAVLAITMNPFYVFGDGVWWLPVVDGEVIPTQLVTAFREGDYYVDELLIGTNRDEASYFVQGYYQLQPISNTVYRQNLARFLPSSSVDSIVDEYADAAANKTNLYALTYITTDFLFLCPIQYIANVTAERDTTVYVYQFTDIINPDFPRSLFGSYHGIELAFVFDNPQYGGINRTSFGANQQLLSNAMIQYWTNFAKSGDPTKPLTSAAQTNITWPTWDSSSQRSTVLSVPFRSALSGYRASRCQYWNENFYSESIYPGIPLPGQSTPPTTSATTGSSPQTTSTSSTSRQSTSSSATTIATSSSGSFSSFTSGVTTTSFSAFVALLVILFFVL